MTRMRDQRASDSGEREAKQVGRSAIRLGPLDRTKRRQVWTGEVARWNTKARASTEQTWL